MSELQNFRPRIQSLRLFHFNILFILLVFLSVDVLKQKLFSFFL